MINVNADVGPNSTLTLIGQLPRMTYIS
uniref:Uncharacterized protein n=1 Tax=Anguilla anguilla TaxID=7936 RepID=A0A0E9U513_ANGAN